MLSLCTLIAILAQTTGVVPDRSRLQEPLLVAEVVFTAIVTSVDDGDSVLVKTANEEMALNLSGIDAPELSQPGGRQAQAFLSGLTLGKTVTVRLRSATDRLARLELGRADVTELAIRAGMGWHCPRYADDRDLTQAEADARAARRGLWAAPQPTPPWLHRGAGSCWQEKTKPRVSTEKRPDFSGTWTAVSPSDRAGEKLRIEQDAVSVSLWQSSDPNEAWVYKLNGTTSRAFVTTQGPADIVAKTRWHGSVLILEERRWMVHGEEATNVRRVFWMDERGLSNVEVSSPRPIGETDAMTLVLRRDSALAEGGDPARDR